MSPATLMTSKAVIYSRLSESVMRGEGLLIINVTIRRLLPHLMRKSVSSIFHIFDV